MCKCQFESSEYNIKINMHKSWVHNWADTSRCLLYKWSNIDTSIYCRHLSLIFCGSRCCATGIVKICLYNIIEIVSSILLFTHGVIMDFLWYYYEWATKWLCFRCVSFIGRATRSIPASVRYDGPWELHFEQNAIFT